MNRLIFATHNANKVKEVRELLSSSFEILSLDDIGFNDDIIEDKPTIIENSIKKAELIKIKTGYDCFADDTGLEVDALNGQPGVFSKRFAGLNASSDENIYKLLEMLGNKLDKPDANAKVYKPDIPNYILNPVDTVPPNYQLDANGIPEKTSSADWQQPDF